MNDEASTFEVAFYFESPKGAYEAVAEWPHPTSWFDLIGLLTLTMKAMNESMPEDSKLAPVHYFQVSCQTKEYVGEGAAAAAARACGRNRLPLVRLCWDQVARYTIAPEGGESNG